MLKAPIPFRGFDERGDVRIYYHGILPHWRQRGCTYFVTFRLADSIPTAVVKELEYQRTIWLRARRIDPADGEWKRRFTLLPSAQRREYEKLIGRLLNESLDKCHGSCILREPAIGSKVASALEHFHGQRVFTGDYVVMPNHVHALLTPIDGFELENVLHSIRSYTANEINRALSRSGPVWQRESYDRIVRDMEQLEAYQAYIAANPEKARLRSGEFIRAHAQYTMDTS
jgi:type I restriction enzyme R subunit